MPDGLNILTLCTGNVSRSVMLSYMLTDLGEANGEPWKVRSAGTHVIEGTSMSARTRDALLSIDELGAHHYGAHRSHQLEAVDLEWAHIVLASEAAHVEYVRRQFPDFAAKTVQFHQFVRFAPLDEPLDAQLADVVARTPDPNFDVADPAGGDNDVYVNCANELWELAQVFATLVTG